MIPPKHLHSRRLLLPPLFHYPLSPASTTATAHNSPTAEAPYYSPPNTTTATFDTNVVMVLSVLLCALLCSLVINSVIRCILSCTSQASFTVTPTNASSTHTNNCPKLANTGIKKKALKTFTTLAYSSDHLELIPGLGSECVICLSEFASGDKVRLLPRCNHGFHVRCIDRWLDSHSSCPTCRNCLIDTCEKIVGAGASTTGGGTDNQQSAASPSLPSPPPQQQAQSVSPLDTVVDIAALGGEGPTRNLTVT